MRNKRSRRAQSFLRPRAPKRVSSYQRRRRAGENDPHYKAFIALHTCIVPGCYALDVEVAHVGPKAFSQLCHDRLTLPICATHHRIERDAHHILGKGFWKHHGLDRAALLVSLQLEYNALFPERAQPQRVPANDQGEE